MAALKAHHTATEESIQLKHQRRACLIHVQHNKTDLLMCILICLLCFLKLQQNELSGPPYFLSLQGHIWLEFITKNKGKKTHKKCKHKKAVTCTHSHCSAIQRLHSPDLTCLWSAEENKKTKKPSSSKELQILLEFSNWLNVTR